MKIVITESQHKKLQEQRVKGEEVAQITNDYI